VSSPGDVALPDGWTARPPAGSDLGELHALVVRHERAARGAASTGLPAVAGDVVGAGAATRRHLLLSDDTGQVRAWATVHDRAAGRSLVAVVVDPELVPEVADGLARTLFAWASRVTEEIGAARGLTSTQIDSGAFADDERQRRWLAEAGLAHVRSWWQMTRPVAPREGAPGAFPAPAEGVTLRTVVPAEGGLPLTRDLATVHDVLETAFTDHFNHHEETFDEFCARLREDPGHRWDHWWIAELVDGSGRPPEPAGALVAAVSAGPDGGPDTSYVEYLGVLRSARGRGVATSLLNAVIADAAERGRPSVGIEVDSDSSTGAADLYLAMGFVTSYVTESWHRDLPVRR
jgi:ribosomal protein S18 acetylase RimI-like enzyme